MTDATTPAAAYRVLARKYRPSTFADLIGQDAMVRTLTNAFETGRIPQAWILTGVRGVGKTTTARILARALNYELPDGSIKGPTVSTCRCSACTTRRSWRAGISTSSRWTRRRITASTTCAPSTTRCATRRCRRATRSTSSTKCTCCRAPPSTRCSRRWKSRRRTPSSCSPPPKSARCRSRCCRAASASICAGSMPRPWWRTWPASPARKASRPRRRRWR